MEARLLAIFNTQREEAAEFFNRTSAGGAITLVASLFMALLFFSELRELNTLMLMLRELR